jgi:hypothetical protein
MLASAVIFFGVSLLGAGCGGTSEPVKIEANDSYQHLKMIGQAYMRAIADLGHPPASAQELLPYIKYKGEGGPSAVFRSPNDGQEYKICWGVAKEDMGQPGENGFPVLAYEQQGKDGIHMVLRFRTVVPMTTEQLQKAPFPPGHQAPS